MSRNPARSYSRFAVGGGVGHAELAPGRAPHPLACAIAKHRGGRGRYPVPRASRARTRPRSLHLSGAFHAEPRLQVVAGPSKYRDAPLQGIFVRHADRNQQIGCRAGIEACPGRAPRRARCTRRSAQPRALGKKTAPVQQSIDGDLRAIDTASPGDHGKVIREVGTAARAVPQPGAPLPGVTMAGQIDRPRDPAERRRNGAIREMRRLRIGKIRGHYRRTAPGHSASKGSASLSCAVPLTRIRFGCSKSRKSNPMCGFTSTLPHVLYIPLPS